MGTNLIRVGITHGDLNGISYEVILKTFSDTRVAEDYVITLYGSSKVAGIHRKTMDLPPMPYNIVNHASDAMAGKLNILNCVGEDLPVEMGKSTAVAGEAAFAALERATADLKEGLIDVLVTAPINKHNIQRADFQFVGHTEYLENKFADENAKSLMILVKDTFRVALVTGHVALSEVSTSLTVEKVKNTLLAFQHSLQQDFGIRRPRIAVLSLNPHAGENGLLGSEEAEIIIPAIQEAERAKVLAFGPYPSDGFFGAEMYRHFDGVVAMYHDQGLIPFKTLAMDEGVNFTAGLPIVRTSPDHGTAYDIAGKNQASEASFRNAIYMAVDIFRKRKQHREAYANPLKKMFFDKGNQRDETVDLTKEDTDL